jgi:ABC-type Mn2+/Zn2+ transport system ATPase subunit
LPDNILIYYSGHNDKVVNLIDQYEKEFKKDLKEANTGDTREFIGIGSEYKALLLSVLLVQPEECKAKQFIKEKLGIASIGNELFVELKRPYYARKAGYDVDRFQPETRFWKAKGITQTFLDKLTSVKESIYEGERDQGYIPPKKERYDDHYLLYLDLNDLQEKFADLSAQDLFRGFDNLKTIEMLANISLEIELQDGTKIEVDQFSDGQFQSIYIYTIIELFKDKNSLTLLDEPDSFLHPEWQFDFLQQIFEITDQANINNHVLMTSHSAVTLIPHEQRNINLFRFLDDGLKCHKVNKSYAIDQLSSQLIKYSEDEQILSIIHQINIEEKPILFTEGSTDPVILKIAWNKLYEEEIPFHIVFAFSCVYLRPLLQDERILNELNGKPAFGLFDFDEAYNEWNSVNTEHMIEEDPYKGLMKKVKQKNSYAILLPIPQIELIEKQIIKDKAAKTTYRGDSEMEIEHLFYGDENTHEFFEEINKPGGGKILEFRESRKTDFSKNIVPNIDNVHFEVFRPMFEKMKEIINGTV